MSRLSSKKLRNLGSSLDGSLNIFPGQFQNILLFSSTLSVLRWFQRSSEYRSVLSLLFSQFSCFLLQSVFQLHVWCLMFGLVVRAEIRRQLGPRIDSSQRAARSEYGGESDISAGPASTSRVSTIPFFFLPLQCQRGGRRRLRQARLQRCNPSKGKENSNTVRC